jgi:hypothetical protein
MQLYAPQARNETDIPLAHTTVMHGAMEKIEPAMKASGNSLVFSGSELMCEIAIPPAIGGVTSTIPKGGILALISENPMFADGLRIAKTLAQFDQFHIDAIVYEYVPNCPMTQAGGLMMAVVNDIDDPIGYEGGFAALRDLATRDGVAGFPPIANASCGHGTPLFKWYYTADDADPVLEQPGLLYVMTSTDMSNATGSSIPLGLIWMHYVIRVRAPAIERSLAQTYYSSSSSLALTGLNIGVGNDVILAFASSALPAAFNNVYSLGWGTIVSADDAAFGGPTWRQWLDTHRGTVITFGPGVPIYWRCFQVGAVVTVKFYATFYAAFVADYGTVALQATVATTAAVKGFKLWNINGTRITGDA